MSHIVLVHATAVAIGQDALLLRGPSGAGKSDLALRMMGMDVARLMRSTEPHNQVAPSPLAHRALRHDVVEGRQRNSILAGSTGIPPHPSPPPQGGREPPPKLRIESLWEGWGGGESRTFVLVADDQVQLERHADTLIASPPDTIRGLLEVRGLGVVRMPYAETARVRLVIDLVPLADVPRMPPGGDAIDLLGLMIPRLKLYAFEHAAPLKCALALRGAMSDVTRSSGP